MKNLFILLTIFISVNCFAQSDWMWSHPYPQGNALIDIFIKSPNTFCAVGDCGTFISSSDYGINWNVNHKVLFGKTDFVRFFKLTESIYYANSSDFKLLKSTNGGMNWNILSSFAYGYINDIKMVNEATGYVIYSNSVLKTTNGGYNWTSVFQASNGYTCYFLDENTGFVGSGGIESAVYIHKTTNGGQNWTNYPLNTTMGRVDIVKFVDVNTGFAILNNLLFLKTTNQGLTWFLPLPSYYELHCLFPFDANNMYALRPNELIASTNGGVNWSSKYFPTYSHKKMVFRDLNTGYVLDGNNEIYFTTDAGTNWAKISNNNGVGANTNSKIEYSSFINSATGIVSGRGPTLLKTTNAGINWTALTAPTYSVAGISMLNASTGFLACWYSCGRMSKTTNGGINWIITDSLGPDFLKFVSFFNQSTGIVADEKGRVFRTTNTGQNWSVQQTSLAYSVGGSFILNETTGFISGAVSYQSGKILKTTNAGLNWIDIYSSPGSSTYNMYFINELTGYCTGSNLMKTTNGGYNWTTFTNFPSSTTKYGIEVVNNSTLFVTGQGAVYKSTNGGLNWGSLNIPTNYIMQFTKFFDANNGIACGEFGVVLRTINGGGIVSVNNISQEIPSSFSLQQNYPNPFNPVTNIKFSIINVQYVILKVYDILGKEVATLVNESLKPGTYETQFDGSAFSSGVYFYKLTTGASGGLGQVFSETKRMLLIK